MRTSTVHAYRSLTDISKGVNEIVATLEQQFDCEMLVFTPYLS